MNTLITQALQAVWNIWGIANFWVRLAITVIVVSPVMVAMASLTGSLTLTAITALFPVLALAWVFLFQVDPLIIPLLQRTPGIRDTFNAGIKLFKKIVAVEILMGVYFTLVPIHNRPSFIAPIFLIIVALLSLWASELKWGWAWKGLIGTLVVLTLLVIFPLKKERVEKEGVLPIVDNEVRNFLFGPSSNRPQPARTQETTTAVVKATPAPEFPTAGEGVATKSTPVKAWLDPGRTYVRPMRSSTDETPAPARYVLVENPAKYFDDVGPDLNQNHRAWDKMPAGQYLVYPLRDDEIYFRWWK